MKKNVFVLAMFCCLTLMAQAGIVKYCMTYDDFVAGNWTEIDDLTLGRTNQACQMKSNYKEVRFKTGDKYADKKIKKEAFAVMYGDQLFVNCRNLRINGAPLDVTGYSQAVRFDKDKVCVMAYKNHTLTSLAGYGLMVASCFVDNTAVRIGLDVGSIGSFIGNEFLSNAVCYLIDSNANEDGKISTKRMNDQFMEELLSNDAQMLEKYKAISSKHNRQSAANVLPILMEKGLVTNN